MRTMLRWWRTLFARTPASSLSTSAGLFSEDEKPPSATASATLTVRVIRPEAVAWRLGSEISSRVQQRSIDELLEEDDPIMHW